MTFRQLLNSVNEDKIIEYLLNRELKYDPFVFQYQSSHDDLKNDYKSVILEMKSLPPATPYKWNIVVINEPYPDLYSSGENEEQYLVASFENSNYEIPPKDLKPWGGRIDSDNQIPEGYYNTNEEKYNKYFSFSFNLWNEIIDTNVINNQGLDDVTLVGEIILEATFNGFTQQKIKESSIELERRSNELESVKMKEELKL